MAGRVALVTGGASGIGRAVVDRFVRSQESVWVADLHVDAELESLCRGTGGGALPCDVTDAGQVRYVVESVLGRSGRCDLFVHSAGIAGDGMLWKLDEATWDRVLDVDLKGAFLFLRELAPAFRERGGGKVVSVCSTLALRARRGIAPYAAAKAGLAGLTRAAARDLGPSGVNVNAVAPGLVETPLTASIPDAVKARLREETCLGRLAEPDDVAAAIEFLCSDGARHITGEVIRVDGGQLS